MSWQLRDGLYHAVSGSTGIFLDVIAGRYFALNPDLDVTVRAALSHDADRCDPECLAWLADSEILVEASSRRTPVAPLSPTQDGEGWGRARLWLVAKAMAARRRAHQDLRRCRLSDFAAEFSRPAVAPADGASVTLDPFDLAASFAQLAVVSVAKDQCLPDTIAFARLSRAAGIPVRIVFGVCAAPFAAHCWAQLGTLVVNDRLERTTMFTPILAW